MRTLLVVVLVLAAPIWSAERRPQSADRAAIPSALRALPSALSAGAKRRAAAPRLDRATRILVIIAHPDDEILIAPLLANRCVRGGATCTLLVLTHGDTVRHDEMRRAAELFHASLIHWTYSDVMSDVGAVWSSEAGSRAALIARIANEIAIANPDLILTLDPQHGTTCHPAHREVGRLVVETGASNVYFIETFAQFLGSGFALSNGAGDGASVWFAHGDWNYVVRDAEIHATQFSREQVESLRTLPVEQRRVWLMPASGMANARCD